MPIKNSIAAWLLLLPVAAGAARDQHTPPSVGGDRDSATGNTATMSETLFIKIGDKEFTAILLDNRTTAAFSALLPLTINLTELNGNEKYFRLSKDLPTDESNPGTIQSGDLMLYGSNTFVLFYESFSTSYRYTKLGKITNTAGLVSALGKRNVTVSLSLR
jgi:hypothetical protein